MGGKFCGLDPTYFNNPGSAELISQETLNIYTLKTTYKLEAKKKKSKQVTVGTLEFPQASFCKEAYSDDMVASALERSAKSQLFGSTAKAQRP